MDKHNRIATDVQSAGVEERVSDNRKYFRETSDGCYVLFTNNSTFEIEPKSPKMHPIEQNS